MDITKIPLSELIDDKYASIMDVKLCAWAIAHGHTEYGDGHSMQSRLDINQNIIEKIDVELKQRELESDE